MSFYLDWPYVEYMIGQTISHYRITAKLGAGGMGEVFLAEDTRLKRHVALKFLPRHFMADDDARSRFLREAQALAALNHPNIVSVFDVAEHDGQPFIAMEFVEGQSLKDMIASGDVGIDKALEIIGQAAEGLAVAHNSEIVHRDIKPDNIIVADDGPVKLMDFGLAIWQGVTKVTADGSTLGTRAYMSPEQSVGGEVDHRTDLWSLGVVLYELLTKHLPFSGGHDAALAYSIMQETPQPLARYCADAPPMLQDIIGKALEKDPEVRYQSAAELRADLKRAVRASDPLMRSYADLPTPAIDAKPRKRRVLVFTSAVAVAVVVTLLILRPWEITVRRTQEAKAAENRLAVMYFDNLADADDTQRNGEIMANLLMSGLSGSSYLQVVSSQRLYDILKRLGKEDLKSVDRETATQVAKESKSNLMLSGSILRTEPEIVVTAQLVDVASGTMIASPRITSGPGEDIFAVVDSLSAEIKSSLSIPVETSAEADRGVAARTTSSTDAYRNYLQGWKYTYQFKFANSEECFRKAIAEDSAFAMAYYGLSWVVDAGPQEKRLLITRARELSDGLNQIQKWRILAREATLYQRNKEAVDYLEKIVEADPEDKSAYMLLGRKYRIWPYLDYRKSAAMYKKALEIDPLYKSAYNSLAYTFDLLGQTDSSLWAINKYIELVPNEPNPYDSRGDLYGFAGNPDAAIASYRKALEIDSNFVQSAYSLLRMWVLKRNYERAERIIQAGMKHPLRFVRRASRDAWAQIMLHQGRLAEYLKRKRLADETARLEYGSEEREFSVAVAYFWDLMTMVKLTDAQSWRDSAAAQLRAITAAFARDTLKLHGDSTTYLACQLRLASRSNDTATIHSVLPRFTAMLDTTDFDDRKVYGVTLAVMYLARQEYDSALFYGLHFVPRENSSVAAATRGILYFKAGQYGQAVAELEYAAKRYDTQRYETPDIAARLYYYLGRAYEASGWIDEAIAQYKIFTDIWKDADPGIIDLEDARARLARLRIGS
jgi:serine/threonine protein kinase/tetratricopeptide (TPR) repeat protein